MSLEKKISNMISASLLSAALVSFSSAASADGNKGISPDPDPGYVQEIGIFVNVCRFKNPLKQSSLPFVFSIKIHDITGG